MPLSSDTKEQSLSEVSKPRSLGSALNVRVSASCQPSAKSPSSVRDRSVFITVGSWLPTGVDVHFLLRSGFDEASQRGISIFSVNSEDVHLDRPKIFRDVREIGPCDVVIVALKTTSNSALESLVPPLLHDGTILLTLQNGLGNEELLAALFGAERVLGGLCFVCLTRRTPASVDHFGHGMLSIGEFAGSPLARTRVLVEAFCQSGIDARLVDDLATERWRKLVWNIPFNGLAVAEGGLTVDKILGDPVLKARCRALMDETITRGNRPWSSHREAICRPAN